MINILVTLDVKDFDLLTTFENKAAEIMRSHGGDIIRAFETFRNEDGSGQEIHLLEFPNDAAFAAYRSDPQLLELAEIRNKAITSTNVVISSHVKTYG